ncbi:MAG: DUF47 domain-containing protein [Candidatus Helarchaeota archaeon]
MKKKKRKLLEVYEDYKTKFMEGMNILYTLIDDFINNKLDRERLKEVINIEKKADRIKEKYIEILYKKKSALPFLVEDRYKLITTIDKVLNTAELIARTLNIYPFEINHGISEDFKKLNLSFIKTMEELIDATTTIETDFKQAHRHIIIIASLRRKAYDLKFDLLAESYKKMSDLLEIKLFGDLVSLIYETISRAEEISDFLNGLIIKYPSR